MGNPDKAVSLKGKLLPPPREAAKVLQSAERTLEDPLFKERCPCCSGILAHPKKFPTSAEYRKAMTAALKASFPELIDPEGFADNFTRK